MTDEQISRKLREWSFRETSPGLYTRTYGSISGASEGEQEAKNVGIDAQNFGRRVDIKFSKSHNLPILLAGTPEAQEIRMAALEILAQAWQLTAVAWRESLFKYFTEGLGKTADAESQAMVDGWTKQSKIAKSTHGSIAIAIGTIGLEQMLKSRIAEKHPLLIIAQHERGSKRILAGLNGKQASFEELYQLSGDELVWIGVATGILNPYGTTAKILGRGIWRDNRNLSAHGTPTGLKTEAEDIAATLLECCEELEGQPERWFRSPEGAHLWLELTGCIEAADKLGWGKCKQDTCPHCPSTHKDFMPNLAIQTAIHEIASKRKYCVYCSRHLPDN